MTAIAMTSQCNGMPRTSCQTSTDSPNEAPNDSSTVPMILREGRDHTSGDDQHDAKDQAGRGDPASSRSYLAPSLMSLYVAAAVPAR